MQMTLTQPEAELLEGLLEKALGEIREEVYHADVSQFKDELKRDEDLLRSILAKLVVEA